MNNVLFVSRTGICEPLGQSQILGYLNGLSKYHDISLISLENKEIINENLIHQVKSVCIINNIKWYPITINKRYPRLIKILVSLIRMLILTFIICLKNKITLIHARSYFPSFIALLVYRLFSIKFIFDMRALWPEELIEANRLQPNGLLHRAVKYLEYSSLKNAHHIISLTNAALLHLNSAYPKLNLIHKSSVIPTCVDLNRFYPQNLKNNRIKLGCIGTINSGWFKTDILVKVISYYLENYPNIDIEIITRDKDLRIFSSIMKKYENRFNVMEINHDEVPKYIGQHNGSMFFFSSNISKLGSAPTRLAELLACGIPILTNSNVGDINYYFDMEKIGTLIEDPKNDKELFEKCDEFINTLKSPYIKSNCTELAKRVFSLNSGIKTYNQIYNNVK